MKRLTIIFGVFALVLPVFGQEKSPPLKDQKDKFSYSIGLNIGSNLSKQKIEINPDMVTAGIKDAIAGKPQLTQDQVKEVMATFEKDMEQKQKAVGEKSAAEGGEQKEGGRENNRERPPIQDD